MKNYSGPFLAKKVVKKGYCGNWSLGLAWDRVKVSQITPFYTTRVSLEKQTMAAFLSKLVNKFVGYLNISLYKLKNSFENVGQTFCNSHLIKRFLIYKQRVCTTEHWIAETVKIQQICIICFNVLCLFTLVSIHMRSDAYDIFFWICCKHLRCVIILVPNS